MIISRKSGAAAAIAALLISGGLVAAGAAAAQPKEKAPRACFFPRDVQSWSSGKERGRDRTVNFRVGASRYFQGTLATSCPDIDWTYKIGFDPRGAISICSGQEANLIVPGPSIGPRTCLVTDIRRLSPEEVAALPKGTKP